MSRCVLASGRVGRSDGQPDKECKCAGTNALEMDWQQRPFLECLSCSQQNIGEISRESSVVQPGWPKECCCVNQQRDEEAVLLTGCLMDRMADRIPASKKIVASETAYVSTRARSVDGKGPAFSKWNPTEFG